MASSTPPIATEVMPVSKSWRISALAMWGIAAIFYGYEFIHRVAPSVITFQLKASLSLTQQQLGTIGAMYFYAYAAFQLPAGILMDRFGIKKVLVTAATILTIGSFVFTFSDKLWVTQLSRFLIGAGSAFAFIGCLKIASLTLPKKHFPLIVGLTNLCGTLGALLGGRPLARLVLELGWRETFFYLSGIGLLITFFLIKWIKDPNSQTEPPSPTHTTWFSGLWLIMRSPYAWLVGLYGALLVAPIAAIPEMWGVEYLQIAYNVPSTIASNLTHTVFIGTALGGPIIGWFMTNKDDPTRVMRLSTLLAFSLLSLFLYGFHQPSGLMYLILVSYGFFTANMLLCFTIMTNHFPKRCQGAAIGFTNMLIMIFAGGIQQFIGGMLDYLEGAPYSKLALDHYRITLAFLPICLLVAFGITFILRRWHEDKP